MKIAKTINLAKYFVVAVLNRLTKQLERERVVTRQQTKMSVVHN